MYKVLYNSLVCCFAALLESRCVKAVRFFFYVSLVLFYKPNASLRVAAYFHFCQSLPIGLQSLPSCVNTCMFCDEKRRLHVGIRNASSAKCSIKNGFMNGPSVSISTQIFSFCFYWMFYDKKGRKCAPDMLPRVLQD